MVTPPAPFCCRQQEEEDADVICLEEREAGNKSCCRREHVQLSSATSGSARLGPAPLQLKRWRAATLGFDFRVLSYHLLYIHSHNALQPNSSRSKIIHAFRSLVAPTGSSPRTVPSEWQFLLLLHSFEASGTSGKKGGSMEGSPVYVPQVAAELVPSYRAL